jgi:hypothetical protein
MLNGAIVTITLHGTVSAAGNSMINTATVTLNEVDSAPANNSSTVGVAEIPTLSEYALMMLALVLGIAGVLVMRKA